MQKRTQEVRRHAGRSNFELKLENGEEAIGAEAVRRGGFLQERR